MSVPVCFWLFADAAYYASWLSIFYGLKDRRLKNLLVFFAENRRFNVFNLSLSSNEGKKEKNGSLLFRNLRFAKIRHIGDYFADYGCKIEGNFTDFLVGFWWLDKEKILLCFWVRISNAFAAKWESRQILFGSALAKPFLFLPLLVLL